MKRTKNITQAQAAQLLAALLGGKDKATATANPFDLGTQAPEIRTFEKGPSAADKPEDAKGRRTDARGHLDYDVQCSDGTRFALYQDVIDAVKAGKIKGIS